MMNGFRTKFCGRMPRARMGRRFSRLSISADSCPIAIRKIVAWLKAAADARLESTCRPERGVVGR